MPTPTTLSTSRAASNTGHLADTNIVHGAINGWTVVPQQTKTTSYTLLASDAGEVIEMNSASATTVTFNSATFPTGTWGEVYRMGAGTVTLVAGAGVTLTRASGAPLTLRVQGSSVSWRARSSTEFVISGDLG